MVHTQTEEFSDEFIPQSNWFKFDKIGNSIKGTFVEKFTKEGNGNLPDQVVFVLKNCEVNGVKEDGETYNVGIKESNTYILGRLKKIELGQRIGFKYEKDIPPSVKGNNPAKSISPYVWDKDPNYESMTVEDAKETFNKEKDLSDIPY